MKKRVITAIIVWLVLAGVVLPPVVADLHALLSRQTEALTIKPWVGWQVVLTGEITLRLYLLLAALCALFVIWAVASSSYINYRSGMIQVTPDIATPAPAGQGQFGTARWADKQDLARWYSCLKIDRAETAQMLEAGKEDYKEVENANVKIS